MNEGKKHLVNFADCYVLSGNRTAAFIQRFLQTFLPDREEYSREYGLPQFAEHPDHTFTSADALIAYLEAHPREAQAVYWANLREELLRGAMCIFTDDGQVIFGLYCETLYPDTQIEQGYMKELKRFCNSGTGLIEYKKPAARSTADFLQRVRADAGTGLPGQ